jgi:hypothetical protein
MNTQALGWADTALHLEAENRELRGILTRLLLYVAEHEQLLAFINAELDAKFERRRAA